VLKETEEFLRESRRLRDLERLKSKGSTRTGRINPLASTKRLFKTDRNTRKTDRNHSTSGKVLEKYCKTEGIEPSEVERRKAAGEYLSCAWPSDRKGSHRVKDCRRPIKLDKGTANYPKSKEYQRLKVAAVASVDNESTTRKGGSSQESYSEETSGESE
jgi:hypothetical protein